MGAGAITLGVGAALATGSGVAHADDGAPDTSTAASSSAASGPSAGPTASPTSTSSHPSSTPSTKPVRKKNSTRTSGSPSGADVSSADATSTDTSTSTNTSTKPKSLSDKVTTEPDDPDDSDGPATPLAPTPSDPSPSGDATPSTGTGTGTGTTLTRVRPIVASPDSATRSSVSGGTSVRESAPKLTIATAARGVTSLPSAAVTAAVAAPTVSPVLPAAAAPVAPPLPANPVAGLLTEVATVINNLILPDPTVLPSNPLHMLVIEVVRRFEIAFGLPVIGAPIVTTSDPVIGANPRSTATGVPSATDATPTVYGNIGKWQLEPNGDVSDFGGQRYGGKTLVEPINLIIVDRTSTSAKEATAKLNATLRQSGFPAQAIHSTGFQSVIDGETYGQQPTGALEAFSNNFFLLPDDHARAFGPAPALDGEGYVWTVAASREYFGLYGLLPTHTYVSYNAARDELANRLTRKNATLVGIVGLGNAVDDSATQTTGDHDGYAIVIQLND